MDYVLKTHFNLNIVFWYYIQLALKGANIIVEWGCSQEAHKTKSKPNRAILLLHDSDDNALVQNRLNNLVVPGPSSSNIEAMFSALKWHINILAYLWYASQV